MALGQSGVLGTFLRGCVPFLFDESSVSFHTGIRPRTPSICGCSSLCGTRGSNLPTCPVLEWSYLVSCKVTRYCLGEQYSGKCLYTFNTDEVVSKHSHLCWWDSWKPRKPLVGKSGCACFSFCYQALPRHFLIQRIQPHKFASVPSLIEDISASLL